MGVDQDRDFARDQMDNGHMGRERRDCYRLGSYVFTICHTGEIPFPPFLARFCAEEGADLVHTQPVTGEADDTGEEASDIDCFRLQLTDRLPEPKGTPMAHRPDLDVYEIIDNKKAGGAVREARLLRFVGAPDAYGYYEETDKHQADIWLQKDFLKYAQVDTVFYSLFALERHLLGEDGLILHCAMLRAGSEALLFSGPSGIGKSTHANLWTQYVKDTQVINGDRALLQYADGRLYAHSWCVSGSSGLCVNRSLPVRAIVFLSQEPENGGTQLHGLGAVKQLISQITINNWNRHAVEHVWELAERIATDVPVYAYGCNMESEAVDVLQQLLGMQGGDVC